MRELMETRFWRCSPLIGKSLAETAETPCAVHPMGETAKLRTAVSVHCLSLAVFGVKREIGRGRRGAFCERSVAHAWEQLHRVGKRFQDTVRPSGYLVADQFTVADLTLAALSSPAATPQEFPYPQPQRTSPLADPLREAFDECGLLDWTREMYARHRPGSAEVPSR